MSISTTGRKARIRALLMVTLVTCLVTSLFAVAAAADLTVANAYVTAFMGQARVVFIVAQQIALPAATVMISYGAILCLGGTKSTEQGIGIMKTTVLALFCLWVFPAVLAEFIAAIKSAGLAWDPTHLVAPSTAPAASPMPI